jgi:hypothetical protein
MAVPPSAAWALEMEARALLTRLSRLKPFSVTMPTVSAADVGTEAASAIERHLLVGRRRLHRLVEGYLRWLHGPAAERFTAAEAQRRLSFLRLRFNAVLTQFDIFADVLTQRCEHVNGVWLGGLDVAAADALELPGRYFAAPPVMTYLDRGHGAAIRRARTRLPGGGRNPVALVRIPRERMVGSGIASSLVHEVGHQGAALLDLVRSLRRALVAERGRRSVAERSAWTLWERWISEIVADFWSVAKVGVAATQGLIGVVSLPRAFVFRVALDDPHPLPWIRVKLSSAVGHALYPDPQWSRLDRLWEALYPKAGLPAATLRLLRDLEATMPEFVRLLVEHRPRALRGRCLREVFPLAERQPARLRAEFASWLRSPRRMAAAAPTLLFAVLGQAKQDRRLDPERESRIVAERLERWALRRTLAPHHRAGPRSFARAA